MIDGKNIKVLKVLVLIILLVSLAGSISLDAGSLFSLQTLKQYNTEIQQYITRSPIQGALLFVTVYIITTGLSLPVAGFMSLCSGVFFGLYLGTLLASLGGIIGATTAFLLSRFLFREMIQGKYSQKLHAINMGMERDGAVYLLSLRLFPVIPYFILNVVMGLTPIRTLTYILVSVAGMLPVTFIFVNAGTQLPKIHSMDDIISPSVIVAFMLLAGFILIGNRLAARMKRRFKSTSVD